MTLLCVLQYPDERLRTIAQPVDSVTEEIKTVIDNMFETMYEQQGVGLAATQVNFHHRIIVMDLSDDQKKPICIINPEIIFREGTQFEFEGCLSFPGVFDKVERSAKVRVKALNREGEPFEMDADGILAICIQHEMDHLDGILFVDHLSRLKQERAKKKLQKNRKREY